MFSYTDTALKLAVGLLCLIVYINVSGKGNLAPLSAADQIQNYVLGGIIGGVIYSSSITLLQFLLVLLIWGGLVSITRIVKNTNPEAKKWIDGEPIVIVEKGTFLPESFKRANLSAHDFSTMLRLNQVSSIQDLKRVQIESNGQLTIIRKNDPNLGAAVIADGNVNLDALEDIQHDEKWLMNELKKQGVEDPSQVFMAEYFQHQLKIIRY